MNARAARVISVSLFVLYLLLIGVGIYLQAITGKIIYGGEISLSILGLSGLLIAAWGAVGILIVWHYPINLIGWIMCAFPISVAIDIFTFGYYQYAATLMLPGAQASLILQNWGGGAIAALLFTFLFLLFPTGRLKSPRWRWVAWAALISSAVYFILLGIKPGAIYPEPYQQQLPLNPIAISSSLWAFLSPLLPLAYLATILCIIAAAFSLLLRLTQSKGEERQQIKWFVYFALFFPLSQILVPIWEEYKLSILLALAVAVLLLSVVGMAAAIAIAIFRYRLYAIDIIIRRTLIYGALTVLLALIYFGIVTISQGVVTSISGQKSPVIIVISTLVIAALFTPLRAHVQVVIDRRFYRGKYDAEQALLAFSIQVRDEMDLEKLSEGLLKVIEDSFHPQSSSLWLHEKEDLSFQRNLERFSSRDR